MKKNIERYIADIYKTNGGYNAIFYDFPGCISAGKTLEQTIKNSHAALQMHINAMIEDKEKIVPRIIAQNICIFCNFKFTFFLNFNQK